MDKGLLACYLGIGVIGATLVTGWTYAFFSRRWPGITEHREELGSALVFGFAALAAWPVVVPMVFLLSGFAKHGWAVRPAVQ